MKRTTKICAAVMGLAVLMTGCGQKETYPGGMTEEQWLESSSIAEASRYETYTESVNSSAEVEYDIDLSKYPSIYYATSPEEAKAVVQAVKDLYEPHITMIGETDVSLPATLAELYAAGWNFYDNDADLIEAKGGENEKGLRLKNETTGQAIRLAKYYNIAANSGGSTPVPRFDSGEASYVNETTGLTILDEVIVAEVEEYIDPNTIPDMITIRGIEIEKSRSCTEEEYKEMFASLKENGLEDITNVVWDELSIVLSGNEKWYRDPETNELYRFYVGEGYRVETADDILEEKSEDSLDVKYLKRIQEYYANN